jgi:hypothetical protein
MKKLIGVLMLLVAALAQGQTNKTWVGLIWDQNPPQELVTGYKIYYGTNSRAYFVTVDAGMGTNITRWAECKCPTNGCAIITNLTVGVHYFFAATAYNGSGLESDFSNEVDWWATNRPPLNLPRAPRSATMLGTNTPALRQIITVKPEG